MHFTLIIFKNLRERPSFFLVLFRVSVSVKFLDQFTIQINRLSRAGCSPTCYCAPRGREFSFLTVCSWETCFSQSSEAEGNIRPARV